MKKQIFLLSRCLYVIPWALACLGLYVSSIYNFLLFHSLAEAFSIVVACAIFMTAWNARRFLENNYLLFIGIAYLFVGALDFVHTVSYQGMGIFRVNEANTATQLWIATRFMQSISLFLAPFFLKWRLGAGVVAACYLSAVILLLLSIFHFHVFPDCFVTGMGLTSFKKASEYIISIILVGSIALLARNRGKFHEAVFTNLIWSVILTIFSELAFTFYIDVYGLSNFIGHLFEIFAFYLIYKAVIETGLSRPYDLLFRNLKQGQAALKVSEERYRGLVELFPDAVLVSRNNRIDFVNPAAARILGAADAEQILGKSTLEMFYPDCRPMVQEQISKVLEGEKASLIDSRIVRLDGEVRSVEVTASPFSDQDGPAIQVVIRDVTVRKETEEALSRAHEELEARVQERTEILKRQADLIELSHDAILVRDLSDRVVFWSNGAQEVYGWTKDEAMNKTADALLRTGLPIPFDEYMAAIKDEGHWEGELAHTRRDGTEITVLSRQALRRDMTGEPAAILQIDIDITERKRAENQLIEAKEEWERTFNAITDPIMIVDTNHRVMKANRAMADKLGVLPPSVEGLLCPEAVHDCNEPPVLCPHARLLEDGQAHMAEIHEERLGGDFLVSVSPLFTPDGRLFGSVHYARDITERKQAEESVRRAFAYNRSLIEASLDPLVTIDADGKITDVNGATEAITGYSRENLIGNDFSDYFTDPEAARRGYRQVFKRGLIRDYELGIRHKDGYVTPVIYNASVFRDESGTVMGVIAAARDITERKRAQEAMQNLLTYLELKVEERTRELSEANQSLQAVNKELESFSYSISHDLRAPLRAIDGFSRMLLRDYAGKLDDDGTRKLNVIRNNTQTMSQLIDDLLSFSRLGRKEIANTVLDMKGLVQAVWKDLTLTNQERNLKLVLKDLPKGMGDQTLLRQVFFNLLSNAVKFSKSRETAVVEVGALREGEKDIYYVKDNGVGFDMKYYNKLFGVFQRLHSTEEFEGTGVGLAIVERIINRHNGKVWAEGEPGRGATFYFTLRGGAGT